MRLTNSDGSLFELKILGYAYPDILTEKYDSNWLIIEIEAVHPKGSWVARSTCLLTWEIEALAVWLEKIHLGQEVKPLQKFIEPEMEFEILEISSSAKFLRVYVEFGLRPKWAPWESGTWKEVWLQFTILEIDLEKAISLLRQQLAQYPMRAI